MMPLTAAVELFFANYSDSAGLYAWFVKNNQFEIKVDFIEFVLRLALVERNTIFEQNIKQ